MGYVPTRPLSRFLNRMLELEGEVIPRHFCAQESVFSHTSIQNWTTNPGRQMRRESASCKWLCLVYETNSDHSCRYWNMARSVFHTQESQRNLARGMLL